MLSIQNVKITYGKKEVIKGISLHIEAGGIYCLLGNNGAGKSTLIKSICGLLKPDCGHIEVFGLDITKHRKEILSKVGVLADSVEIYSNLSAYDFLRMTCLAKQCSLTEVERVLQLVNLTYATYQKVSTFSLGMKQRLAIANALVGNPSLLVLDEPTNGMDPAGRESINQLIRELVAELKCTVLLSTHLLHDVENLASHIAIIEDGSLKYSGTYPGFKNQHLQLGRSMELITTDNERCLDILTELGLTAKINNDLILVESVKEQDCLRINQHIFAADIGIYQSYLHKKELANWFVKTVS